MHISPTQGIACLWIGLWAVCWPEDVLQAGLGHCLCGLSGVVHCARMGEPLRTTLDL